MKKLILSLVLLALASSASAYTCTCLGTQVKQFNQHTEYSGYCHIRHIPELIKHGEKFDKIEFNNKGSYSANKDLANFISSIRLMNNLNESNEKIASVYDQTTGFICTGAPALQLPADFYDSVIPLFGHQEVKESE